MSAVGKLDASFYVERAETSRLAWAFGVSLALHLLIFGGYETGRKFGWWQNWQWPAWLQPVKTLAELLKAKQAAPQPQPQDVPLMFVDVSPAQESTEPPKQSPFYSDRNSLAANPDAKLDSTVPVITGKQTDIVRTEDVPRTKAFPLQPSVAVEPAAEPQKEAKPKTTYAPGDLTMAKPDQTDQRESGEAKRPRPKTIVEAKARQPESRLSGEKMKQEGGVRRRGESSLDVSATGFGAYDKAIISAVQNRWFDLLDSRSYSGDRTGKVTLRFHLNSDGSISEMGFVDNTVDLALGLLCQSAIKDPAPFAPWPTEMKQKIGAPYREVTFTFYYN